MSIKYMLTAGVAALISKQNTDKAQRLPLAPKQKKKAYKYAIAQIAAGRAVAICPELFEWLAKKGYVERHDPEKTTTVMKFFTEFADQKPHKIFDKKNYLWWPAEEKNSRIEALKKAIKNIP
jgi:hypothetical protein